MKKLNINMHICRMEIDRRWILYMTTRLEMKIIDILKVRSKKQLGEIENRLGRWKFTTQVRKKQYIAEEEMEYIPPRKNRLSSIMTSLIGRNYLCAPMSVYFNAYRDNAYNRGGEEILKVNYLHRCNFIEKECWINHLSQRLAKAKNKPLIPVQ